MTDSNLEESIATLMQLGFERNQATDALARYNYDVERSANYLFSGHADASATDEHQPKNDTSIHSNFEEITHDHSAWGSSANPTEFDTRSIDSSQESVNSNEEKRQYMIKEHQRTGTLSENPESASWSVVPFTPKESNENRRQDPVQSATPSLTYWSDPEDPSERVFIDAIPTGLRPPKDGCQYAPIFVQALFNVTLFQQRILSFRPTPCNWGEEKDYWNENGGPVSGYMYNSEFSDEDLPATVEENQLSESASSPGLMDTDDQVREASAIVIEQTKEHQRQTLPKCVQVIAELQKLFAYLGNTRRRYGNVVHLTQALTPKHSEGRIANNMGFDLFLDLFLEQLNAADKQNMIDTGSTFEDLYRVRAKVELANDSDTQDVYYLSLQTSETMHSFYECLDPFMISSYEPYSDSDEELGRIQDERSSDRSLYKITTFEKLPPLLLVTLEDRTSEPFRVEKTIFLDRYLEENKDLYFSLQQRVQDLKNKASTANSRAHLCRRIKSETCQNNIVPMDILNGAADYFGESDPNDHESKQSLKRILSGVCNRIEQKLEELQNVQTECQQVISTLFDVPELQHRPYDLRAALYHDGKSGTGHHWAHIWVESSESNLLEDIPSDGGWYRFCDAVVTPVSEQDVFNETSPTFAVLYADRNVEHYTKSELEQCTPQDLMEYILKDNLLFEEELQSFNNRQVEIEERLKDLHFSSTEEKVPTADTIEPSFAANGDAHTSPMQQSTPEVNLKRWIYELTDIAKQCDVDDYRLLERFELFLSKAGNTLALEYFIRHFSSATYTANDLANDTYCGNLDLCFDEANASHDQNLQPIFHEYEAYKSIGGSVSGALSMFSEQKYHHAIQRLLVAKRQEGRWKTRLALNNNLSNAYPGLEILGFDKIIKRFGKICLKILNDEAYEKAMNKAYRSRGFDEAIRIAHYAQTIVGPEGSMDSVFDELGKQWLKFPGIPDGELEPHQVEQLNTLLMTYLEGQVHNPETDDSEYALEETSQGETWKDYKRARSLAESSL